MRSKQNQPQHNTLLGARGELMAKDFLIRKGYQVLETNFRQGRDEIDIIAFDPHAHELVFVEVKTREDGEHGHPSQAVNHRKVEALRRAANSFRHLKHMNIDYRFDVITILPQGLEHFENVTWR